MSNPPNTLPGSATITPSETSKARSQGADVFHVLCNYHTLVGDFDSLEAALEAAAKHLRESHASAVESKSTTAEVEITKSTRFRVADLEGYEKAKE